MSRHDYVPGPGGKCAASLLPGMPPAFRCGKPQADPVHAPAPPPPAAPPPPDGYVPVRAQACPTCWALVPFAEVARHREWHSRTDRRRRRG